MEFCFLREAELTCWKRGLDSSKVSTKDVIKDLTNELTKDLICPRRSKRLGGRSVGRNNVGKAVRFTTQAKATAGGSRVQGSRVAGRDM